WYSCLGSLHGNCISGRTGGGSVTHLGRCRAPMGALVRSLLMGAVALFALVGSAPSAEASSPVKVQVRAGDSTPGHKNSLIVAFQSSGGGKAPGTSVTITFANGTWTTS